MGNVMSGNNAQNRMYFDFANFGQGNFTQKNVGIDGEFTDVTNCNYPSVNKPSFGKDYRPQKLSTHKHNATVNQCAVDGSNQFFMKMRLKPYKIYGDGTKGTKSQKGETFNFFTSKCGTNDKIHFSITPTPASALTTVIPRAKATSASSAAAAQAVNEGSKATNHPSKGSKATNPSKGSKAPNPSKGSKATNPSKGSKAPNLSKGSKAPNPFKAPKPSKGSKALSPTFDTSVLPSNEPSLSPSGMPSDRPSRLLSDEPSLSPSEMPSDRPSRLPSDEPSLSPSEMPSDRPSRLPSDEPSLSPSEMPSDMPSRLPSDEPSLSRSEKPSVLPSVSVAPTAAPTRPLWVNPDDSAFSPLSTDDDTVVETIPTLRDDATVIVKIGFAYNWFGDDLNKLVIQSNGQLFMDTSNTDVDFRVYPIGSYNKPRIAFANGDMNPSEGGEVKVGRKSGADKSFKVSFEDIQWYDDDEEINVQVELFPNGDIIFCYGSGEMGTQSNTSRMAAGVENFDLGKAFPIPDAPFDSDGIMTEWPTDSCWKFQMP